MSRFGDRSYRGDMVSVGGECPNGIHTVDLNSDSQLLTRNYSLDTPLVVPIYISHHPNESI